MRRAFVLAGLVAATAGGAALRHRQLTWGATAREADDPMPGDEIVADPHYVATNAVGIHAPASAVWPWLVQMGAYSRAGWYSLDRFDNGGVPSARGILPQLQHLQVGDVMPTAPDGSGFLIEAIDPGRFLVLTIRDPEATTSSVLLLDPVAEGRCRLVVRLRLRSRPTLRGVVYRAIMEVSHVPMTLVMLRGIRLRAEGRGRDPGARWGPGRPQAPADASAARRSSASSRTRARSSSV